MTVLRPFFVGSLRTRADSKSKVFPHSRLKPQRLLFIVSNQNMTRRVSNRKYYHNNEPLQSRFSVRVPEILLSRSYLCMRYENDG
jgi:hypothetical protein